ncbi:diguanylate cyclase (GGDEF) domain-containing protein [Lacrimispora sphenoides]|jgi:diguanylate cyclase (GGDEF)-like protein|uniref:sensor domain-containing diguanylate cyclase n=1 Tax=Lacrimispora sphenoides TaxID=29370 RepID=UPI0008D6EFF8|nr:sensor domain-containing diguanylate cyclase [Lacrimispora sphenoides]SEU00840.1 diguanylate cyclase (GGDEF) domain-containing protein [Lacrimispora sphenoides]
MMADKEKDRYSLRVMTLFGLVVSVIIGIFALNIYYFKEVEKSLVEQTYQDLKRENDEALTYFRGMIRERFEVLEAFSAYGDLPEGPEIGVLGGQGITYYGIHESQGVKGGNSISRLPSNGFNGQSGIALSVPVVREGQAKGLVSMEYTAEELGKYLNSTELSPYGASLVFTRSGELVATCPGYDAYANVYDILKTMEFRDEQSLEQMKKTAASGGFGYVSFYYKGSRELLYYQPAGVEDWMVASMVKTESYDGALYKIKKLSKVFIASSTVMVSCTVLLIICIIYLRKKEAKRAQKDYLTGVYTRETARKLVEQRLKGGGKKRFYACMFLDIDDFKKINDTFGHHKGDLVLTQAGQILSACTRKEDVIVRFGGDEFCIWLYGLSGRKQPEAIAKRILNAFHASGTIHASIGITLVGEHETEYDAILRRADQALYLAKGKGKNQFAFQL